jgi:3-oxoacyl-[acyl-carrier-protein] synthase II
MQGALRLYLEDAALSPDAIGFVNGTAPRPNGETSPKRWRPHDIFGARVPMHSLKGHFGHSLGACGAIEAWLSFEMMRDGCIFPTANLETVDERCGALDYIIGEPRKLEVDYLMSRNFAFGGINTALIIKRVSMRRPH